LIAGAVAAAAPAPSHPSGNKAGLQVRLGVCDWTIGKTGDPAALGLAGSLGLDGVQVSLVPKGDSLALVDPALQRAFLKAAERTGVAVASFAIGDLNGIPLKSDPRAEKWLAEGVDIAAAMNVKIILVPFFGKGDLKGDPAGVDAAVAALKRLAPKAEAKGIVLALENTLTAGENLKILERTGSPAVQVYYDVANSQDAGYPILDEIRLLGARVVEVHAKDTKDLYGKGSIDFPAVRKALEDAGFSGWLIMEGTKMPLGLEQSVRYDADYLRTIFMGARPPVSDPPGSLDAEVTILSGKEFLLPKLMKSVSPEYPWGALRAKVTGAVIVEAVVGVDGRITSTRILKSIPALDQAAADAVKNWVYEPLLVDSKPRPRVITVAIDFSVSRRSVKANLTPAKPIRQVSPVYPEEARKSNIEGIVVLGFTVGDDGRVKEVTVLGSVPGLDQAAIDAIKEWQYAGALYRGKPISYSTTTFIKFSLYASKERPESNAAPGTSPAPGKTEGCRD
jgi:TonB family protein